MMVSAEHDPRRAGVIWVQHPDVPCPVITPRLAVSFRPAGAESIAALAEGMGEDSGREIFRRLETGRQCYAAWAGETLSAYGWVSFGEESIGELNLRLRLLPGEAYIWDCGTLPAFRQNYLYSALLVYILGELRSQNVCRVWIGADLDNVASQRGIARAGFQPVADLVIARVLTLRSVWMQARPGVPESLVAEARRAFLNNRDEVWPSAGNQVRDSG
ncbi:MAG TPA: GNAT family N-acetyltransferase [Anaerolineales bacterium]|nr:GNAT family N-acetyltransferase [Anaerolineales bacterium]